MAWQRVPGLSGKVFIPECQSEGKKKNPCPDCFACQQCSEERCRVCKGPPRHPSDTLQGYCSTIEEVNK